jgi:nucleoside-diphosphate-sugar epimerase
MRIFVTGAAGLIGGEVAHRLAARGHRVTALVHRNPAVLSNRGEPVALHATLHGDVGRPGFGLADADRLAADHDLILHCAATTRFDLSDADYQTTNVAGAQHAVDFARAGGCALLHVSTAYVCGLRDGTIGEDDPLPAAGFANGYEASKARGEAIVAGCGLHWAIARPSVVVGAHGDGAIRTFDTIYAAFKLIAQGRVRHMPASEHATIDFVPIDHVAAGLVALAENMDVAAGGRFHLVCAQPIPVTDFTATIAAFPQFHAPTLVAPDRFDPDALPAAERRLFRHVAGLYASYFQRDPRFDDTRARAVTGLACPPTGMPFLRQLIDYAIDAGFLPSA